MANVFQAMKKAQAEQQPPAATAAPACAAAPAAIEAAAPTSAVAVASRPGTDEAMSKSQPQPTNGYSPVLVAHYDRGGTVAEQFRHVRTSLMAQYPDQRFTIMVTSADAGEGKTVSTGNLGIILSERQDRTTLMVDCDLRRAALSSLFHARGSLGMVDLLRGQATLEQCVQRTVYPNLFVLPAGTSGGKDVAESLARPELEEIVAQLRVKYDHVLIDSPPVNSVADAGILGHAIGEALMVVRMNKTNRESVERAIRLLKAANVKVAGIVLTHQKYFLPSMLYRYS